MHLSYWVQRFEFGVSIKIQYFQIHVNNKYNQINSVFGDKIIDVTIYRSSSKPPFVATFKREYIPEIPPPNRDRQL